MAIPNIGQIVAEVYQDAYTKPKPFYYYIVQLKDRRRFIAQRTYLGCSHVESVRYPSGRYKTAHFNLARLLTIGDLVVPVYEQPVKRSEPTLRDIPRDWTPYEWKMELPARLAPEDPIQDSIFLSKALWKSMKP